MPKGSCTCHQIPSWKGILCSSDICVCVRERGQEIAYTDAIMLLVMDPSDEVCLELE